MSKLILARRKFLFLAPAIIATPSLMRISDKIHLVCTVSSYSNDELSYYGTYAHVNPKFPDLPCNRFKSLKEETKYLESQDYRVVSVGKWHVANEFGGIG